MSSAAPWVLSQVQVVAEALATVAFALSGVIEAARKRLDAVGICVVGGWVLVAAQALALPGWVALLIAALIATALRVAAVAFDWRLPAWRAAGPG